MDTYLIMDEIVTQSVIVSPLIKVLKLRKNAVDKKKIFSEDEQQNAKMKATIPVQGVQRMRTNKS